MGASTSSPNTQHVVFSQCEHSACLFNIGAGFEQCGVEMPLPRDCRFICEPVALRKTTTFSTSSLNAGFKGTRSSANRLDNRCSSCHFPEGLHVLSFVPRDFCKPMLTIQTDPSGVAYPKNACWISALHDCSGSGKLNVIQLPATKPTATGVSRSP